jgi:hypothetical protein
VKDGDVLFIDADAVDHTCFDHPWFKEQNFVVVPVQVPYGKTVADCLAVGAKEQPPKTLETALQKLEALAGSTVLDRRKYDGPWSGIERRKQ